MVGTIARYYARFRSTGVRERHRLGGDAMVAIAVPPNGRRRIAVMVLMLQMRLLLLGVVVGVGHCVAASVATIAAGMSLRRLSLHIGTGVFGLYIVGVVDFVSRQQVATRGWRRYTACWEGFGYCRAVEGMLMNAAVGYAADQEAMDAQA